VRGITQVTPRKARPITGGAARSAAGQIVSTVAGALTTLILARLLGPAAAGRYAVAMSLVIGLQTFGTLSLQLGIGYYVGRGTWAPRQALRETQLTALCLGAAAILAALLIRTLIPSAFHGVGLGLTMLAASGVPFALSWTFTAGVALATDNYELFALPPALQNGIGLIAVVSLGAAFRVPGALAGLTLSHGITAIVSLAACRRSLPKASPPSAEKGQLRHALRFALQTHAANAMTFITYRLDIFILNSVAAARQVGQYSIAVAVTQAVWLLPGALSNVVMPRIAQVSAGQIAVEDDYQEMIERKGVRHAAILALASGICLVGALILLVLFILGSRFHESIELGLILLPGSALLAITAALASVMTGRGRPDYSLAVSLITAPVAVGLYLWLIPADGAVGAALGSSLAYVFGFVISAILARRMLHRSIVAMIIPTRIEWNDYADLLRAVTGRRRLDGTE
jgi:O-antigen/teichoic acid export membrane protein